MLNSPFLGRLFYPLFVLSLCYPLGAWAPKDELKRAVQDEGSGGASVTVKAVSVLPGSEALSLGLASSSSPGDEGGKKTKSLTAASGLDLEAVAVLQSASSGPDALREKDRDADTSQKPAAGQRDLQATQALTTTSFQQEKPYYLMGTYRMGHDPLNLVAAFLPTEALVILFNSSKGLQAMLYGERTPLRTALKVHARRNTLYYLSWPSKEMESPAFIQRFRAVYKFMCLAGGIERDVLAGLLPPKDDKGSQDIREENFRQAVKCIGGYGRLVSMASQQEEATPDILDLFNYLGMILLTRYHPLQEHFSSALTRFAPIYAFLAATGKRPHALRVLHNNHGKETPEAVETALYLLEHSDDEESYVGLVKHFLTQFDTKMDQKWLERADDLLTKAQKAGKPKIALAAHSAFFRCCHELYHRIYTVETVTNRDERERLRRTMETRLSELEGEIERRGRAINHRDLLAVAEDYTSIAQNHNEVGEKRKFFDKAIALYERCLSLLEYQAPDPHYSLGNYHSWAANVYKKAVACLTNAGEKARYLVRTAELYARAGDGRQAIANYREAISFMTEARDKLECYRGAFASIERGTATYRGGIFDTTDGILKEGVAFCMEAEQYLTAPGEKRKHLDNVIVLLERRHKFYGGSFFGSDFASTRDVYKKAIECTTNAEERARYLMRTAELAESESYVLHYGYGHAVADYREAARCHVDEREKLKCYDKALALLEENLAKQSWYRETETLEETATVCVEAVQNLTDPEGQRKYFDKAVGFLERWIERLSSYQNDKPQSLYRTALQCITNREERTRHLLRTAELAAESMNWRQAKDDYIEAARLYVSEAEKLRCFDKALDILETRYYYFDHATGYEEAAALCQEAAKITTGDKEKYTKKAEELSKKASAINEKPSSAAASTSTKDDSKDKAVKASSDPASTGAGLAASGLDAGDL